MVLPGKHSREAAFQAVSKFLETALIIRKLGCHWHGSGFREQLLESKTGLHSLVAGGYKLSVECSVPNLIS